MHMPAKRARRTALNACPAYIKMLIITPAGKEKVAPGILLPETAVCNGNAHDASHR
jgi:hypothetical protein